MRNEGIEKIIKAYMSDKETEYDDEVALVADTLESHGWMHKDDVVPEQSGFVVQCPYCGGIRYDHMQGCPNVGKKFLPTIKDLLDGRAVK